MDQSREEFPFDVLFVGGGPANMAGAIHLLQLAQQKNLQIEVGLIEKGDAVGSHSLSGAILDPISLKELIPDYMEQGFPMETADCRDAFYYLTSGGQIIKGIPTISGFQWKTGFHIIGNQLLQSDGIEDGTAEGMRSDGIPLFNQSHLDWQVLLLCQLQQMDGAGQIGRTTADKHNVKFQCFSFFSHLQNPHLAANSFF